MARPVGRPKINYEKPAHKNVDKQLNGLRQITRDLRIAEAYRKSLLDKQQAEILRIRSKYGPNGRPVRLQDLADAADLSLPRIAQIVGSTPRKPKAPPGPAPETDPEPVVD